ncbi:hypothetical protein AHAS_Ahas13G0501200 [Arachis hypogaea]
MVKGRQGERVRLYVRGTILGYKRSKSNQYPNTSLIQIEGVNTKEEVAWYAGKKMAYIYKAKVKKNGTHYRCIWGKVTRPHGNSGIVRAKFKSNLPPKSMFCSNAGSTCKSIYVSKQHLRLHIAVLMVASCFSSHLTFSDGSEYQIPVDFFTADFCFFDKVLLLSFVFVTSDQNFG